MLICMSSWNNNLVIRIVVELDRKNEIRNYASDS